MLKTLRKYWRRFWRNPHHEYFKYVIYYDMFNDDGNPLPFSEWWEQENDSNPSAPADDGRGGW